jgi:hypothetical protein
MIEASSVPKITPIRSLRPQPDVTLRRTLRSARAVALILVSAVSLLTLQALDAQPAVISEFRSIWRVALEEISRARPGRTIVVLNETMASCGSAIQPPCFFSRGLAVAAPDVSDGDRRRIFAALADKPRPVDGLDLPQLRLISLSEISALSDGVSVQDFWPKFYKRFPESAGYVVLGIPALDESRQTAWVIVNHSYDTLGGEGWLLLLKRDSSGWQLVKKWTLWQA